MFVCVCVCVCVWVSCWVSNRQILLGGTAGHQTPLHRLFIITESVAWLLGQQELFRGPDNEGSPSGRSYNPSHPSLVDRMVIFLLLRGLLWPVLRLLWVPPRSQPHSSADWTRGRCSSPEHACQTSPRIAWHPAQFLRNRVSKDGTTEGITLC